MGKIVALADVEQILTDVQGPGPVDVLGDMIVVFDSNLNVVWTWDTFDHLDVNRAAVLGEKCTGAGGCTPYYLAKTANDWTHGNAVQQTPDGELLYSSRHQDWLIKISYRPGPGRRSCNLALGKGRRFSDRFLDPYPWFSHQHDANIQSSDLPLCWYSTMATPGSQPGWQQPGARFCGWTNRIRKASFILNADLGVYSLASGRHSCCRTTTTISMPDSCLRARGGWCVLIEADGTGHVVYEGRRMRIRIAVSYDELYTPELIAQ